MASIHTWRSGRAKCRTIAAGTKGQRTLTNVEAVDVDCHATLQKCIGCIPDLPLSPSGCMPFVTKCQLCLYVARTWCSAGLFAVGSLPAWWISVGGFCSRRTALSTTLMSSKPDREPIGKVTRTASMWWNFCRAVSKALHCDVQDPRFIPLSSPGSSPTIGEVDTSCGLFNSANCFFPTVPASFVHEYSQLLPL